VISLSIAIGQKLKELRAATNKTVAEVAKDSGIFPARVSFYEMDRGIPTISILQKLAKGLNCTIFDIIDEPLGRKKDKCIHSEICPFYQKILNELKNCMLLHIAE